MLANVQYDLNTRFYFKYNKNICKDKANDKRPSDWNTFVLYHASKTKKKFKLMYT